MKNGSSEILPSIIFVEPMLYLMKHQHDDENVQQKIPKGQWLLHHMSPMNAQKFVMQIQGEDVIKGDIPTSNHRSK